jgi:hypothetical protein
LAVVALTSAIIESALKRYVSVEPSGCEIVVRLPLGSYAKLVVFPKPSFTDAIWLAAL